MFKLDLEKAEEPEIKLPTSVGSYNLPRLNHDEIENLNGLITNKEIESEIRKPPTKVPRPDVFTGDSTKHSSTSPLNLFPETEEEETLPNSFYEASITQIPKPDKDTTRKENYRPISLTNIGTKILHQIPANQLQHILCTMIKWDYVILLIDTEKAYQNSTSIYDKKLSTKSE